MISKFWITRNQFFYFPLCLQQKLKMSDNRRENSKNLIVNQAHKLFTYGKSPTLDSLQFLYYYMLTIKAGHKTQKFIFCVATQIKYVAHTGEK